MASNAVIDTRGDVIGINSAIYTPTGTTAGIGFAIPINTAKSIANDLITSGRVHRAFLGVETYSLAGGLAEALDLPEDLFRVFAAVASSTSTRSSTAIVPAIPST